MDNRYLLKLNRMIASSYECFSFMEFLKLAILQLHELVAYDSGMFFCAISRDCSFFKPYITGSVEGYYEKQPFAEREDYLKRNEENDAGAEALVYKATDLSRGDVTVDIEPRTAFLMEQENFHVVCVRLVYKGQFLGEIYLHRSQEKPDFDHEDLFVLRLLQPHIANVFNIIHTVTAVNYLETNDGNLSKLGLCVFGKHLSLEGGNVTGLAMLKIQTVFGSSVLYHLKELCEDLYSNADDSSKMQDCFKVLKTTNGNLMADIILKRDSKGEPQYLVTMRFQDSDALIADYQFKFTKREADIIDGIIQGKSNTQLAEAFNLSENTIKTHVRSIYRKVGANNRTELTYILMSS